MRLNNSQKKHFPQLLLALFLLIHLTSKAQQWGDYTLYSVMGTTTTQLMDTNGNTVKTWTHTSTAKSGYSCYLMPGGYLWRSVSRTGNSFSGGPINGQIQKVDWNGTLLWDYVYSTTDYCTHHDICPLPNGNILVIAYERKVAGVAAAAGSTFAGEVWPEKVVEIKPTGATTGEVVWEWKIWDHIVQDKDAAKPNYQSSIVNHPELLNVNYKMTKDWIHMNGVDYNPILDQIAVSSHNTNEWYIIDHSTTTAEAASHSGGNSGKGGDFLYRWGNPAAYNATGTAVLNVTHDSHWIPEGTPNAGRLVGFNNRGVSSTKSSVDQIVTPINGYNYNLTVGSAYEPATYYRHACNGYSSNASSSDQLPNGNMLVCIALAGTVYELDPKGNSIWTKTVTGAIQQAHRYNKCFTDNQPPAIPEISLNSNILSATTAISYQWYLNGQMISNATSQTYTPATNGIYLVRITDNNGCVFRYSQGFKFSGGANVFKISSSSNTPGICIGNSAQINSDATNETGTTTYFWTSIPAGFTSTSKNITVSPLVNTTYKVIAINNGVNDSATVMITVNPKPNKPTVSQAGNILKSTIGITYKWFEDTTIITGINTQSYSPAKNGNYRAKIIDNNGCESDYSDAFSFILSGISATNYSRSFILYPNPTDGIFKIENKSGLQNVEIKISDVFGKIIFQTQNIENINMSDYSKGLYFVTLYSNQNLLGTFKLNLIK